MDTEDYRGSTCSRMEEEAPIKPSVAQLAGKLKGYTLPMPGKMEKSSVCPHPPKMKIKSSPCIEKLQANLALSPTVLLSPPKSPESKQPPTASSPVSPCSSLSSTLHPTQLSCEDEAPVSFEQPFEGTPLLSINKSRARLSFKRRLPTRRHRKSACEEAKWNEDNDSPCEPESDRQNGDEGELIGGPLQEDTEDKMDSAQPTNDPQEENDRTEQRDVPQENEGTQITHIGNKEEVTEGAYEPSDCEREEKEEKEETEEDRTEVKEDRKVLDVDNNPE